MSLREDVLEAGAALSLEQVRSQLRQYRLRSAATGTSDPTRREFPHLLTDFMLGLERDFLQAAVALAEEARQAERCGYDPDQTCRMLLGAFQLAEAAERLVGNCPRPSAPDLEDA